MVVVCFAGLAAAVSSSSVAIPGAELPEWTVGALVVIQTVRTVFDFVLRRERSADYAELKRGLDELRSIAQSQAAEMRTLAAVLLKRGVA